MTGAGEGGGSVSHASSLDDAVDSDFTDSFTMRLLFVNDGILWFE